VPPGGCALLEGSHHKYRNKNIDESLKSKVLQMKRCNHLDDYSTTHKRLACEYKYEIRMLASVKCKLPML
jgi:hypothetical protein